MILGNKLVIKIVIKADGEGVQRKRENPDYYVL
jgi:hypothetical protein